MIWHLPHIRALAARWGSPVLLVAKPRSAADQLFAAESTVADVLWMDRNPENRTGRHDGPAGLLRLVAALRARRLRRAILLHHSRTLALAMLAAGITERYGYGFPTQRPFLNRPPFLPNASQSLHPYDQATAWLAAAGIPLADPEPRLPISPRARRAVRERLGPARGGLLLFGIGSSEPYKQWGADRFAMLAAALAQAGWRRFALAGGVAEATLAAEICTRLADTAEIIPAIAWTLPELAALAAEFGILRRQRHWRAEPRRRGRAAQLRPVRGGAAVPSCQPDRARPAAGRPRFARGRNGPDHAQIRARRDPYRSRIAGAARRLGRGGVANAQPDRASI